MQLINHTPVTHPQPVPVTSLKLRQVVVRCVGVGSSLFNLRHNPPLPIRRELGERFVEGPCGDDGVVRQLLPMETLYQVPDFPACAREIDKRRSAMSGEQGSGRNEQRRSRNPKMPRRAAIFLWNDRAGTSHRAPLLPRRPQPRVNRLRAT